MVEGLDGCEALVTHGAAGDGVAAGILQASRSWGDEAWAAACDRLRSRGWLDAEGRLTPAGTEARDRIERVTDERAIAPWYLEWASLDAKHGGGKNIVPEMHSEPSVVSCQLSVVSCQCGD